MTAEQFYKILQSTGHPVAYHHFLAPQRQTPYICYLYTDSDDLMADDINYQAVRAVHVEYYVRDKDFYGEQALEQLFAQNGLTYKKADGYLEGEQLYMTTYDMQLIVTGVTG